MFDLAYPIEDNDKLIIDDVEYELDLSFDNVLRLIDMLNDDEVDDASQIEFGLKMLIGESLDINFEQKIDIFYRIFQEKIGQGTDSQPVDIDGNPMPVMKEEKTYDLKQDAEYIFASFMSDYGIDLFEQQGKLHWFKFKALLGGLTDGSKFLRVIEIRTSELPKGKGTEKQRKQMLELKRIYALKGDDINETEDS